MEHLAGEIAGAFSGVKFIAEDGMAKVMKVDPNLVGPSAVDRAFDETAVAA